MTPWLCLCLCCLQEPFLLIQAATQREAEVCELRQLCEASKARLEEVQDSLRARSSEVEVLQSSLAQLQELAGDESEQGGSCHS